MLNHKGTQTIQTERLTLRKIQENDYIDMYKYTVKEEVAKYVSWTPHESINDTKALCDMWIDEYKNNDRYNWAIVYDNTVIGSIDVVKIIDTTAMIGWQIDSTFWNKGIVTEAATAVRDFLFGEIGIEAIEAEYVDKNIGSGRVMQKIGMTQIPLKDSLSYSVRHIAEVDGMPIICYKLTKKDWIIKNVKILKVEKDTDIAKELLDFIKNCSWLEIKEHLALMVENWGFTEWETIFVATVNGKIVGMCSIMKTDYYPLPELYPWISSVYLREDFRGNRISEKLIEFANHYAKEIGFYETYIPTEFEGLYEKYGYQFIKEITNYGGGIDRLLVKEI